MDSSSEEDYLWEKCSNSDSEAMAHEEESDFDKRYKKKLQKELFQNGDIDESQEEPRVRKKKKIKHEPVSPAVKDEPDSDSRGKPALLNGHGDAERVLELKVKQERASLAAPRDEPRKRRRSAGSGDEAPARKKKKAKKERRDEPDAEEPPKKKRKKHKRETDESDTIIIDKFEAEETVVEKRRSGAGGSKIAQEKPFTSKEFVEDDSDSVEEPPSKSPRVVSGRKKSPSPEPAPRQPLPIRERITYEEESQDRPSPSPGASPEASPRPGGRLARYLRSRRHLTPAPAAAAAAVTRADDVWLVRCPRSLDVAALAGAALTLGARSKLKVGGRAYEAAPVPSGERAALLLGGARWAVRSLRVRGALQLRVRVPRVRAPPAAPAADEGPVPLPATKTRHPLLGLDYERAPAPRPRPRSEREPPGSEPDEPEPDGPEPDGPEPDEPERRRNKKKKKKEKKEKRKRERAEEAPARSPSPLPRKKRRAAPAADVWDSERAIEESLFNF